MKGAIEYALIFLTSCFILSVLIQFTGVMTRIHQGHLYLNYITHLTENYDGDLNKVNTHTASQDICRTCIYTHSKFEDRYEIEVIFPISLPVLSYHSQIRITTVTVPFEA